MISLVVAMTDKGVIGVNNTLPWRLPNDLQRFKSVTIGKPVVMGRKTFESIGKPLPGRQNIVITRQSDLKIDGCTIANSLDAALVHAGEGEVMIIGGAEIYTQALPHAQRINLTQVHADIPGDAYFPQLKMQDWHEILREHHKADERHAYAYSFVTLERT